MGEDVLGVAVGELDGAAQKLGLVFIDAAVLGHLVHQHQKFILGQPPILLDPEDHRHQLLPLGEEPVNRGQQNHQRLEKRRGEHGEALGAVLGQALGGDFTEDQHHNGNDMVESVAPRSP